MILYLFQNLPLWAVYLLIVLLILISIRGGMVYFRYRKKKFPKEDDSSINTIVGATLGLLAFMLAFTFGLSSSRFEARKQFLLEEVNSIETAWLRAGLMNDPYAEQLQKQLVEYTEIRIWFVEDKSRINEAITRSEEIQNKIWAIVTEVVQQDGGKNPINSLLVGAVNDMFDNQTNRIAKGAIDHIPDLIWIALLALIVISMFEVGYLLGKTKKSNWVLILALSLSFSAIIMLIVDLDSLSGMISINNQVLYDMYDRIKG